VALSLAWLLSGAAAAEAGDMQRAESVPRRGTFLSAHAAVAKDAEGIREGEGEPLPTLGYLRAWATIFFFLAPCTPVLYALLGALAAIVKILWKSAFLAKAIEKQFPSVKQPEGEDVETCAICLMEMQAGEFCRELECKHRFHSECIMGWWRTTSAQGLKCRVDCPLCRRSQQGLRKLLVAAGAVRP